MNMTPDDLALDWRSIEIVQALGDAGEPLTTSTIRDATAIEDNRRILYRVSDHLEPEGLVRTQQPAREGTAIPAKKIELTDDGRDVAQAIVDDQTEGGNLNDLPRLVEQLQAETDALSEQVTALHDQLTQIEDQLADRRETDAAVSNALAELDERLTVIEDDR
jgi:chromosome segregation ATPase